MPCQIEQHKIPMDDRKSQKKKKGKKVVWYGFHPSPSEAHEKPPLDFREI